VAMEMQAVQGPDRSFQGPSALRGSR
jgi:hypothetical protein